MSARPARLIRRPRGYRRLAVPGALLALAGAPECALGDGFPGGTRYFPPNLHVESLDGTNGFVVKDGGGNGSSGAAVSCVGDINADGFPDIVMGAPNENLSGNTNVGACYVVFGGPGVGASGSVSVPSLHGATGFMIRGIAERDVAGGSVRGVGDFNGDGIDDIIIGADQFQGPPNGGSAYVVFGAPDIGSTGYLLLSLLDGADGFVVNGIDLDDQCGYSVSGAGDMNGDGYADVIIGAPRGDRSNGNLDAGEVYVIFGGPGVGSTGSIDPTTLNGANGFTLTGISGNDRCGAAVARAGDLNGDGIEDVIIGAPRATPNGIFQAGESYVVFGRDTAIAGDFPATLDLAGLGFPSRSDEGFVVRGVGPVDRSGSSVAGAGDLNADGITDLIIGAPSTTSVTDVNLGHAYVIFGAPDIAPTGIIELQDLNGASGFVLNGEDVRSLTGTSLSAAGDINADGFDDVVVGASRGTRSEAGVAYVVFGGPDVGSTGMVNLADLDGFLGFRATGADTFDNCGVAVSAAGDVNADGIDDLLVGASNAYSRGATFVIFGHGRLLDTAPPPNGEGEIDDVGPIPPGLFPPIVDPIALDETTGVTIDGADDIDHSGAAVANAGDFNGDGIDDVFIGAPSAEVVGEGYGRSYLVFGSAALGAASPIDLNALNGSNGFAIEGIGGDSGRSIARAGDVNHDGFEDIIIGAPYANRNGTFSGESHVLFGGPGVGPSGVFDLKDVNGANGFRMRGSGPSNVAGSVGGAGDVNADGVNDVIVGAPGIATAFVAFGHDVNALGPFPASLTLSDLNGPNGFAITGGDAATGGAVDGGRDVNGDGVADLLIGAWAADPHGTDSGEAYVLFGAPGLGSGGAVSLAALNGSNGFVMRGYGDRAHTGVVLAFAGDVNDDGFEDMILGAPQADPNPCCDIGKSYVVFGGPGVGAGGVIELSALNGHNGFVVMGVMPEDRSGEFVSGVGDVNHDGIDDFAIGASRSDPFNAEGAGTAYVIFGAHGIGSTGLFELADLDGTNGFVVPGIDPGDGCGPVSAAGDPNADGIDDVIIGAPGGNPPGRTSGGRSFIIFGRATETGDAGTSPDPSRCPGDLDADGHTDIMDFALFAPAFGASPGDASFNPAADLDANGVVGIVDFGLIAPNFGCGP